MNIALIDDGVEINSLTKEYVCEFLEIKDVSAGFEKQTANINSHSHGTICASIIRKMAKSAKLYSLKILDTNSLSASTDKLVRAFEWCLKNDIHIINLSLGTVNSRDFNTIQKWVRTLVKSGKIIVAAVNNKNTYTLPASLPEVIGVSSEESLSGFKFVKESIIGVDILAGSKHPVKLNSEESITTPFCNSYAAPAVSGRICDLMNKDCNSMKKGDREFAKNLKEKRKEKYKSLESDSVGSIVKCNLNEKTLFTIDGKNSTKKSVPIISIICSEIDLNKLNTLFYNDNIFPVAICGEYVLSNMRKTHIYKLLYKISAITDCDLIILYNITRGLVSEDLSIKHYQSRYKLSYGNIFRKIEINHEELEDVYKNILNLLV